MIRVKVGSIVEEGPGFARALEITIDNVRVETPDRVLVRTDLNAKRSVPTQIVLENKLVLLNIPLSALTLAGAPSDEANLHLYRAAKELERLYGDLHGIHGLLPYLYPSGKGSEDFLRNVGHVREFVLEQLPALLEARDYYFGTVLVPPLRVPLNEYEDLLRSVVKRFEKLGAEVVPVLDVGLGSKRFIPLLNYVVNELDVRMVCVKYREVSRHLTTYQYLKRFLNKSVGFIYIDVPRHYDLAVKDFAMTHLVPLLGSDLIAPRLPPYRGRWAPPRFTPGSFRLMHRKELRLPPISTLHPQTRASLLNELDIDFDMAMLSRMKRFIVEYEPLERDMLRIAELQRRAKASKKLQRPIPGEAREKMRKLRERLTSLYALTRIQEVKASTKELGILRHYIRSGEMKEYTRERHTLSQAIRILGKQAFLFR